MSVGAVFVVGGQHMFESGKEDGIFEQRALLFSAVWRRFEILLDTSDVDCLGGEEKYLLF